MVFSVARLTKENAIINLSLEEGLIKGASIMKLKVNQKVMVYQRGEYKGGSGFIYKLDRFARTYSISTDDGKFFEFNESDLGTLFDAV